MIDRMSSNDADLKRARAHIDDADRRIIEALEERMEVVEEEIKPLKDGESPHDEARVNEVLETRVSMGSTLSSSFVRELFKLIIKESERLQKK